MRWTAKLDGRDLVATSEQLEKYRKFYIRDQELLSRMAELLWFDMYVLDQEFGISPNEVLPSIKNLEAGEPHSGIKKATPFKKPPLKGLWHKHYFSAHFLMTNITLALGKDGVKKLVNDVMDPKKSRIVTPEMLRELAHRVTHEPVEQRDQAGKMTGEWIVFAKHDGKHYYLCLNTHDAGDQLIYDRIKQHCVRDFPDLLKWLP